MEKEKLNSSLDDLIKLEDEHLLEICNKYAINANSKNKFQKIGSLLHYIHHDLITHEILNKLDVEELKDLCVGANISKSGRKDKIISRILSHVQPPRRSTRKRKAREVNGEGVIMEIREGKKIGFEIVPSEMHFLENAKDLEISVEGVKYFAKPKVFRSGYGWQMDKQMQKIKIGDKEVDASISLKIKVLGAKDEEIGE